MHSCVNSDYYYIYRKKKIGFKTRNHYHPQWFFLIAQFQILLYFNLWAINAIVDDDSETGGI